MAHFAEGARLAGLDQLRFEDGLKQGLRFMIRTTESYLAERWWAVT